VNENLGEKLRGARLMKKMTLKDLSSKCGLSVSHLSQIERGGASPSLSTLDRITKALDETIWRLLKDEEEVVFQDELNKTELKVVNDVKRVNFGVYPTNKHINQSRLVKKDQRKILILPGVKTRYEMLTPDLNRKLQILYMEAEPGVDSGPVWFEHEGEECCIVLSGQLYLEVGSEKFLLESGDSLYFPSGIPHHWQNMGEEKVILMWILTPPSF
jgi:transcriptional regulator with XRE-family HTH domain